jgi:hypothetical protein
VPQQPRAAATTHIGVLRVAAGASGFCSPMQSAWIASLWVCIPNPLSLTMPPMLSLSACLLLEAATRYALPTQKRQQTAPMHVIVRGGTVDTIAHTTEAHTHTRMPQQASNLP